MRSARENTRSQALVQTRRSAFTGCRYLPRDAYTGGGERGVAGFDEPRSASTGKLAGAFARPDSALTAGSGHSGPGQLITSTIVDYIADLLHSHKRMRARRGDTRATCPDPVL